MFNFCTPITSNDSSETVLKSAVFSKRDTKPRSGRSMNFKMRQDLYYKPESRHWLPINKESRCKYNFFSKDFRVNQFINILQITN